MMADERADIDVDELWDQVLDEVEELKAAGTIPADTHIHDTRLNSIKARLKLAVRGTERHSRYQSQPEFVYNDREASQAYSAARYLSTFGAQFAALQLVNLVATEISMYAEYPWARGKWQNIATMAAIDADTQLRYLAGTHPYPAR